MKMFDEALTMLLDITKTQDTSLKNLAITNELFSIIKHCGRIKALKDTNIPEFENMSALEKLKIYNQAEYNTDKLIELMKIIKKDSK